VRNNLIGPMGRFNWRRWSTAQYTAPTASIIYIASIKYLPGRRGSGM
jgi:hypothetical protein